MVYIPLEKFYEKIQNCLQQFLVSQVKVKSIAFKILYSRDFSDDGSNKRGKEGKAIYCFELLLQELDEDLSQTCPWRIC